MPSGLCRHLAASEGSYKVTEWLLSEQADINSLDRFKRTPLEVFLLPLCLLKHHFAACTIVILYILSSYYSLILHLVLTAGVSQDAVRGDFNELSKLLIDHGGKVWSDGKVGITVYRHQHLLLEFTMSCGAEFVDLVYLVFSLLSGLQLVSLDQSQFSGALVRIPSQDLTELEPDWEIDPAGLVIMDKLGMIYGCSMQCNAVQAVSYCYCTTL